MGPPYSLRITRVRRYSGYRSLLRCFAYEAITLFRRASHPFLLQLGMLISVRTPILFPVLVWPLPRSLATTYGISFDFSSSAYLDVSVQRVPLLNLCIQLRIYGSSP